jgi:hypothetical protein
VLCVPVQPDVAGGTVTAFIARRQLQHMPCFSSHVFVLFLQFIGKHPQGRDKLACWNALKAGIAAACPGAKIIQLTHLQREQAVKSVTGELAYSQQGFGVCAASWHSACHIKCC